MRNRNTTDLDDYHDQHPAPSFSKGVARIAPQSVYAKPKKRYIFTSSSKTVDGTVLITVVSSNSRRVFFSIVNNSAATVFLGFGVATDNTGANAIQLKGNSSISFDSGIAPQNDVVAITGGAQVNLTVLEGVEQL